MTTENAAPAPENAPRKPRLTRAAVRKAQRSLELLVTGQRLGPRTPAGRRIRQIEKEWLAQLGNVDAGTASALRVAASQQYLLERVDFVLGELPHPANRGRRAARR